MAGDGYWDVQRWQSRVKSRIVQKYFRAWSGVMAANAENEPGWPKSLAYFDLFCGRGEYRDGSASTPLLVLEEALQNPALKTRISIWFNDVDTAFVADLERAVDTVDGISALRNRLRITNEEVGDEMLGQLRDRHRTTLSFLDPWGYKGLTVDLIAEAVRGIGSECILFFNFNVINRDIGVMGVRSHMEALFGSERLRGLLGALDGLRPAQREDEIMRQIRQALAEAEVKYQVDFQFLNKTGARTRHYLIHACTHPKGHSIMKDIMAGESSASADGVASYVHDPAHHHHGRLQFDELSGHEVLGNALLEAYAGRTMTRAEIQADHSPETRYRPPDYRLALLLLEERDLIECEPGMGEQDRRAGSFPEWVHVTFPEPEEQNDGRLQD